MPVEMKPVVSSNLHSIGHDPDTGELHVKFKNGSVYVYDAVEADLHDQLHGAESAGKFFNEFIKAGGYNWRKV